MVDYIVYIIVRLFVALAQALPLSVSMAVVRGLAFLFHYVIRLRRKLIEENIHYAFPNMTQREVEHTAHRMWIHLFTLALEVAVFQFAVHILRMVSGDIDVQRIILAQYVEGAEKRFRTVSLQWWQYFEREVLLAVLIVCLQFVSYLHFKNI